MIVGGESGRLFAVTKNGYGKRLNVGMLKAHGRGTGGQIYMKTDERTGEIDSIGLAKDADEIMVITSQGMIMRTPVKEIRVLGRSAKGVRVVRVEPPDFLVSAAIVEAEEE
jgi:DNA gyrase subunit A